MTGSEADDESSTSPLGRKAKALSDREKKANNPADRKREHLRTMARKSERSRMCRLARNKSATERAGRAVMGGSPPTPSHVSIRAMPFLFPLPQCSYVSFPLCFLRPRAAAESCASLALTKSWGSAVAVARGAGWGGRAAVRRRGSLPHSPLGRRSERTHQPIVTRLSE